MEVLCNKPLTRNIFMMVLTGDFPFANVKPGQFVNILIGDGKAHPLRRPISIASSNVPKRTLTLVYRLVGEGTEWLSKVELGNKLDVLGPLGNGFPLPDTQEKVLLVGGGVGIPPLYQLAKELARLDLHPDIILGFSDESDVFWVNEFKALGSVTVCTEDGSCGEPGFVTAALDQNKKWTALYSCGPKPMLQALKAHFSESNIIGFVSLEERMACGIGACLGCTCLDSEGNTSLRVCKDGPVFNWKEVAI